MIEKDIESKIIGHFEEQLSSVACGCQIIGTWQTTDEGVLKNLEKDVDCIITVKTYPRQYETFTIPQADIQVEVALAMRIENDNNGTGYIEATELIQDKIHSWQKSYLDMNRELSSDGFNPTGFRIDGGDCGLDKTSRIWQFSQTFTIQGVILT